jgi:superfamily I DNA/RNA helicase
MTSPNRPNKFAGTCRTCGGHVLAQQGTIEKVDGKWLVAHTECPVTDGAEPTAPETRVPTFTPTAEQFVCVKAFATGDPLVIQAGAGTGKTSTLRLLAAHADTRGLKGVYTAFNRKIVDDTALTMSGNVQCSTAHSLAFRAYGRAYSHRLNSVRMTGQQIARILGVDQYVLQYGTERRVLAAGWVAGLAIKTVRQFCQSADRELSKRHVPYVDGIDPMTEDGKRTYSNNNDLAVHVLPYAVKAWADIQRTDGQLRFEHDHYLKMWQLNSPVIEADFILFDEAQDADPVMLSIIEQQMERGVQVVAVGDSQQAIYEWRGAVDALDRFAALGGKVAYLSQSFRFGHAVAEVANGLLARIGADLRISGFGERASVVGPAAEPNAILTRTNAGAVREVISLQAAGRRPFIVGGAVEAIRFAKAARTLQAGQPTDHPELACFSTWGEVQDYVENDQQGGDLRQMVKLIDDFGIDTILRALDSGIREEDADVVISTAHRSKGREWNSVQLGSDFFAPKEDAGDLSTAELRLLYVACTRAKCELDIEAVGHAAPGWKPGKARG